MPEVVSAYVLNNGRSSRESVRTPISRNSLASPETWHSRGASIGFVATRATPGAEIQTGVLVAHAP